MRAFADYLGRLRSALRGQSTPGSPLRCLSDLGERQVARLRIGVCALLLVPAALSTQGLRDWGRLGLTVLATAGAVGLLLFQRRRRWSRWLGFISSGWDVTIVSLTLTLAIVVHGPLAGLNSKTTFEIYFLILGAAGLRYDVRISVFAVVLAVGQYAMILAFGVVGRDLTSEMLRHPEFGRFSFFDQWLRLGLLGTAGALSALLVRRSHRLLSRLIIDPVTGLGNRHFFDSAVTGEPRAVMLAGKPCTVAMIDVDHFKAFNDAHGHACGDDVLRRLGATLSAHIRSTDIVARWGGEEFVVVIPGADRTSAHKRLELVRQAVAATDLGLPEGATPRTTTISVGIATYPADGEDITTLLRHADMRMLVAKQRGRDQVVADLSAEEFEQEVARRRRPTPRSLAALTDRDVR